MKLLTESGDYKLPSKLNCTVGNALVKMVAAIPAVFRSQFTKRHGSYQAIDGDLEDDQQGVSEKKWEVIQSVGDLTGKSVLDIGCAEGYFCRKAALGGAERVLGVDGRMGTLVNARCISLNENLPISYRLGAFPSIGFEGTFDVVFCLSVLHHLVSTKDIWRVLSDDTLSADLESLRGHLKFLRRLVRPGGACVIEMPYEYDDATDRTGVDFDRFASELVTGGFESAESLGSWDYNELHREIKDRIIYVARAGNSSS
jgi:SAM-dependent methyltransferase